MVECSGAWAGLRCRTKGTSGNTMDEHTINVDVAVGQNLGASGHVPQYNQVTASRMHTLS
jgi:hypothetical protein